MKKSKIRNKVKSITKKIWKKYKMFVVVELLVLITIVISVYAMYKMIYEFENEKAANIVEDINRYIQDNEPKDPLDVGDFINMHHSDICGTLEMENLWDEYTGYAFSLELYNNYEEILGSLKSNEWTMKIRDYHFDRDVKCINLNEYFPEEEIKSFEEFNDQCRKEYEENTGRLDPYSCANINKVIGYYDDENFVPVEIEFYEHVTEDRSDEGEILKKFTIRNENSISKNSAELVTIQGWRNKKEGEDIAELKSIKKTKESNINKLDYFINVYKENPDEPQPNYGVYDYWEFEEIIDADWEADYENNPHGEVTNGFGTVLDPDDVVCSYKFSICVNLHYMTITNEEFQKNVIGALVLFHLIGILLIIVFKKYEKRGEMFDSMKYTFINAIAHEMKTPAAVLVNSVECIEEEIHIEKQTEYLNKIKKESLHINRLLLDMLEYNKLSSSEGKLGKEKINVKELIEEVLEHYQSAIENKNIELQWEIKSDSVIRADRRLMEMVIDNYLSNAVKYCKNKGIIKITVDKGIIAVYNNGEYIHPEKQKMIWEPLYVVDESRKRREGSSGMGLAISAKILDLHGFEYKAENKKAGVEFSIIAK